MSGFSDFLLGAVAGGVRGVDEQLDKDADLGRQKDLEAWRMDKKAEMDRALRDEARANELDPDYIADTVEAEEVALLLRADQREIVLEEKLEGMLKQAKTQAQIDKIKALGVLNYASDADYVKALKTARSLERELKATDQLQEGATANQVAIDTLESQATPKVQTLLTQADQNKFKREYARVVDINDFAKSKLDENGNLPPITSQAFDAVFNTKFVEQRTAYLKALGKGNNAKMNAGQIKAAEANLNTGTTVTIGETLKYLLDEAATGAEHTDYKNTLTKHIAEYNNAMASGAVEVAQRAVNNIKTEILNKEGRQVFGNNADRIFEWMSQAIGEASDGHGKLGFGELSSLPDAAERLQQAKHWFADPTGKVPAMWNFPVRPTQQGLVAPTAQPTTQATPPAAPPPSTIAGPGAIPFDKKPLLTTDSGPAAALPAAVQVDQAQATPEPSGDPFVDEMASAVLQALDGGADPNAIKEKLNARLRQELQKGTIQDDEVGRIMDDILKRTGLK